MFWNKKVELVERKTIGQRWQRSMYEGRHDKPLISVRRQDIEWKKPEDKVEE